MFRLRPLATFTLVFLCVFGFGQKPNAKLLGAWYDVTSHSKAPWLGFRICNIGPGTHGTLSVKGRSFSLPFSKKQEYGPNWVRLGHEGKTCDVILVRVAAASANGQTYSWKVTRSGSVIAQGKTKIEDKALKPFAPPGARIKKERKK